MGMRIGMGMQMGMRMGVAGGVFCCVSGIVSVRRCTIGVCVMVKAARVVIVIALVGREVQTRQQDRSEQIQPQQEPAMQKEARLLWLSVSSVTWLAHHWQRPQIADAAIAMPDVCEVARAAV